MHWSCTYMTTDRMDNVTDYVTLQARYEKKKSVLSRNLHKTRCNKNMRWAHYYTRMHDAYHISSIIVYSLSQMMNNHTVVSVCVSAAFIVARMSGLMKTEHYNYRTILPKFSILSQLFLEKHTVPKPFCIYVT